jgi:membrane-bound ClpP family serine protease
MSTLAWPLLLLAFGLILLIAEVFVPSGGLIGFLAVGCLALSLWLAFSQSFELGLKFLIADFLLLPLIVSLALYLWPKTPVARRIFLRPPAPDEIEVSHAGPRLDHLVGQYGRALTPLRLSGLVDFDGRKIDALSEDGLIDSGTLVLAVRVKSGQLVVRIAHEEALKETFSGS